jgi:peptidoglycan hydrolase-like protein with peptidoglycan-binding domain
MKKIISSFFVLVLVFSFSINIQKAHASNIFTRFLSFGSKGEDVKALQEVLKNEGLLGAAATGYYGTATKEAVTQLQAKNNLEPIGVVGPKTLALVATKKSTAAPSTITTTTAKDVATIVPVCSTTSPASITVTSPNGGEVYYAGQLVNIKWKSCNVPATTNLEIMLESNAGAVNVSPTGNYIQNDGNETVTLQTTLPYGLNFKIGIYYTSGNLADRSDNLFTINGSGVTAQLCNPIIQMIPLNPPQVLTNGTTNMYRVMVLNTSNTNGCKVNAMSFNSAYSSTIGLSGYQLIDSNGVIYTNGNGVGSSNGTQSISMSLGNNLIINPLSLNIFTLRGLTSGISGPTGTQSISTRMMGITVNDISGLNISPIGISNTSQVITN